MEIPLTQGRVAIIDPEDWPLVSPYSWHAKLENGELWYAATSVTDPATRDQVTLKMHRLITGAGPDEMVDHREPSQTLDNRRSNLRVCSNALNQQNTGSRNGSSRFKGVSWSARKKKWLVQFRCHGQYHFVGYFADEEAAARAYDQALAPLAGEFARLNFPKAA
jgi:AP2 domain